MNKNTYKLYNVICFCDVDYIATTETNLGVIKEWYEKCYGTTIEYNEMYIVTPEARKRMLRFTEDERHYEEINIDMLINRDRRRFPNEEDKYIYLYGTEW